MKKNTLLNKIIFKKSSRLTLFFGIFAFILGWIILLFSIDFYYKTKTLFEQKDNKEYLIISKEVNSFSWGASKNNFSKEEIKNLENQKFIRNVAGFKTNLFEIWVTGNYMIPVQTELFFESIDDKMLDIHPETFVWNEKENPNLIPVLISRDFLNLYNFGYAIARGLPQVPPSLVMVAPPLNAKIYKNKKSKDIQLKIVGFTDRIPSILVPSDFMNWANNYFEPQENNPPPARLMLEVGHVADPELLTFLEEKGYAGRQENLNSSKMIHTAFLLTSVVGGIGLLFVFLSVMIFLSNTKTMLLEVKQEIKLLLELGYSPNFLHVFIFFRLALLLVINFVFSWILFGFLHKKIIDILQEKGLEFSHELNNNLYFFSAALFFILILISNHFMKQQINYGK